MALGELGVPTYDMVLDMSWAEFRIRLFSYNRQELREWEKIRFLAYENLKSTQFVMNSKAKIPKTIEKYMPLSGKNVNKDERKERLEFLKKMQEQYNKDKNG